MKAGVVFGPDESPVYADFPEPEADGRHRILELVGAGIHPVVRSLVAGHHYGSAATWPAVAGVDAVARTADDVLVYTGGVEPPWGTMAERIAAPDQFAVPLPDHADPLAVASGLNPGLASWLPITTHVATSAAGLGTVLVLGATGVAGRISVDNALALGATRVIAVGRNSNRLASIAARHPAGVVAPVPLLGDVEADAAAVAEALAGEPPGIVLDFVWGPVAEAAFRALQRHGLDNDTGDISYVELGAVAGATAAVPAALLRSRRIRIVGAGAGSTPMIEIMRQIPIFMGRIADGTVDIPYTAYPLSRIGDAWNSDDGTRAVVVPR